MTEHKILVVEDSEPLRKVLAEMLRDEKFDTIEANGGEAGLKMALEQKPDMIITDIVMFPVDGLEMAKQIRESGDWGAHAHIIALTNQNSSEDEVRISKLNLTAYLVKADTGLDEVVKRVKEVFKKKSNPATIMEKETRPILVIEDDIALRSVLVDKLTNEGFIALQAADGEEGLRVAAEKHPALILLDIFMPRMDGITMLSKLRSMDDWGKHVDVIVLTNSTDAQTIAKVSSFGGTDFLIKSEWSLEALVARMREKLSVTK